MLTSIPDFDFYWWSLAAGRFQHVLKFSFDVVGCLPLLDAGQICCIVITNHFGNLN